MANGRIKESNGGRWILWVFVAMGMAMFFVGVAVGIYFIVDAGNTESVTATVTAIYRHGSGDDASYDVRVSYTFGGEEYSDVPLGYWHTGMDEGDEIEIRLDPDDPENIGANAVAVILPCVLMGFGLLFAGFPVAMIVAERKKDGGRREARKRGTVVKCRVTEVTSDISYSVNGKLPNDILVCVSPDGKRYVSAPFARKYSLPVGGEADVYVLPDDPEKYWVDLNSVTPPDAEEFEAVVPEGYTEDPLGQNRG